MNLLGRRLKSRMERGLVDFGMLEAGDRVAVAVSGGPDSLSLLDLFLDGFGYATNDFSLLAVHVDLGFGGPGASNRDVLEEHFRKRRVEYRIVSRPVAPSFFSPETTKSPCFLCSLNRRKALYEIADREGCNRIAYGHHQDDIVETLLINVLYGRKVGTMYPVQPVCRDTLTLIRPFVYIREAEIKRFAAQSGLPVLPRLCPVDGKTRRQRVKDLIAGLQRTEKRVNIRKNLFTSLYHVELRDFSTLLARGAGAPAAAVPGGGGGTRDTAPSEGGRGAPVDNPA